MVVMSSQSSKKLAILINYSANPNLEIVHSPPPALYFHSRIQPAPSQPTGGSQGCTVRPTKLYTQNPGPAGWSIDKDS